ncbi:MAG: GNAT family N-acetyltransferase [Oscillospiraceae bacterium]|nr:GNAT family N-acetyltransferase [Oscillospiraceae bacterium]
MIEYRKAAHADIPVIIDMRIAYMEETHPDLTDDVIEEIRDRSKGYFREHLNRDCVVYLACDGENTVACVFFVLVNKPASPLFLTGKTGTLMNVFTKKEYRQKGIAKKLVSMVIEDGKKWDLSYIELRSTNDGYPLYKSLDFIEDKSIYMSMKLKLVE